MTHRRSTPAVQDEVLSAVAAFVAVLVIRGHGDVETVEAWLDAQCGFTVEAHAPKMKVVVVVVVVVVVIMSCWEGRFWDDITSHHAHTRTRTHTHQNDPTIV